jgi:hypothetical protein
MSKIVSALPPEVIAAAAAFGKVGTVKLDAKVCSLYPTNSQQGTTVGIHHAAWFPCQISSDNHYDY